MSGYKERSPRLRREAKDCCFRNLCRIRQLKYKGIMMLHSDVGNEVEFPLYVLSAGELFVIESLAQLQREFESYDIADNCTTVHDSQFRRVKVAETPMLRPDLYEVKLAEGFDPMIDSLLLRAELIQVCLINGGDNLGDAPERLFSMDLPALFAELSRLQSLKSESSTPRAPDWRDRFRTGLARLLGPRP